MKITVEYRMDEGGTGWWYAYMEGVTQETGPASSALGALSMWLEKHGEPVKYEALGT